MGAFNDKLAKTMNHKMLTICATFGTLFAEIAVAEPTKQELENAKEQFLLDRFAALKERAMGVGQNAIRAPFGRYLLIQKGKQILALKLEKRIPTGSEFGKSRFSWVSYLDEKQTDNGVIEIEEGKGGSSFIEAGGIKVEWSAGDWLYVRENIQVATTEATEPDEIFSGKIVSPADSTGSQGKISWYSSDALKRLHEATANNLRQDLKLLREQLPNAK